MKKVFLEYNYSLKTPCTISLLVLAYFNKVEIVQQSCLVTDTESYFNQILNSYKNQNKRSYINPHPPFWKIHALVWIAPNLGVDLFFSNFLFQTFVQAKKLCVRADVLHTLKQKGYLWFCFFHLQFINLEKVISEIFKMWVMFKCLEKIQVLCLLIFIQKNSKRRWQSTYQGNLLDPDLMRTV